MFANRVRRFWILRLDGFVTTLPEESRLSDEMSRDALYLSGDLYSSDESSKLWCGGIYKKLEAVIFLHDWTLSLIELARRILEYFWSFDSLFENLVSRIIKIMNGGDIDAMFLNLGKEVIPA